MSRYNLIAYSCSISRDLAENTASHQRMIDQLCAGIAADGWPGVVITGLETVSGATQITIEPGPDALTMDLLRKAKAEFRLKRHAPKPAQGHLRLVV